MDTIKKSLKRVLFFSIFLGVLFISKNVYAENENSIQWTDFSNAKIEFGCDDENNKDKHYLYDRIEISNVNYRSNSSTTYYLYITHDKKEPIVETDSDKSTVTNADSYSYATGGTAIGFYNGSENKITKKFEEYGDLYIWVLEYTKKDTIPAEYEYKFGINGKKIERPQLMNLGNRFYISFSKDDTFFANWEIHSELNRKLNIKVGEITDNSILKSLQKEEKDSLNKLMSYAKDDKGIYTTLLDIDYNSDSKYKALTQSMDLKDKKYYYVYLYLDDEDKKYVGIEDINIYQASVYKDGNNIVSSLNDRTESGFNWDIPEDVSNNEESTQTIAENIPASKDSVNLKNPIIMPSTISKGKGKISVDSSITKYTLYYQAVDISNTNYEKVLNIVEDYKIKIEKLEKELETINNEEEYNKKVEEYYNVLKEIDDELNKYITKYNENNWIQIDDGNFSLDTSKFSGEKPYVIWAKLVDSDGNVYYNNNVYVYKEKDTSKTNKESSIPTSLPKTGNNIKALSFIILFVVLIGYFYYKNKKYKGI